MRVSREDIGKILITFLISITLISSVFCCPSPLFFCHFFEILIFRFLPCPSLWRITNFSNGIQTTTTSHQYNYYSLVISDTTIVNYSSSWRLSHDCIWRGIEREINLILWYWIGLTINLTDEKIYLICILGRTLPFSDSFRSMNRYSYSNYLNVQLIKTYTAEKKLTW